MSTTQYVSVREASQILGVSERKVMDLIERRELQAYRIADKFLRLKKNDVTNLRNSGNIIQQNTVHDYTASEKFKDFIYFNDFYILTCIIIFSLLYIIFYT